MMLSHAALILTILSFAPAALAQSKDCAPPAWMKLLDLRKKADDLVGAATGSDPGSAWIAAKRKIADPFVDQHADDILKLPQLRGRVNTKAYAPKEISRALKLAVAYQIKNPKRIEYEVKCNRVYIALSTSKRNLTAHLRSLGSFADDIEAALTGKIDPLETAAFEKEHKVSADDTADADEALKNLTETARKLDAQDFIEKELIQLMRLRTIELKKAVDNVRTTTFKEDRDREFAFVKKRVLAAGTINAAVKDWQDENFVSAGQTFQKCAQDGEAICQFITGIMHLRALGLRKDPEDALKWLRRAAGAGHTISKLFVGIYTFAGVGTKSDPELAAKWVNEAFQQGWTCDLEIRSCGKVK